jgi:hypothetical protein
VREMSDWTAPAARAPVLPDRRRFGHPPSVAERPAGLVRHPADYSRRRRGRATPSLRQP